MLDQDTEFESAQPSTSPAQDEELERRALVRKLGKFALYAAPFTVLAHTNRAEAASGTGPHKGPIPHP